MVLRIEKIVFIISIILMSTFVFAEDSIKEDGWEIYHAKLFFENDCFSQTDSQYSSGEKFNFLYHVNKPTSPLYDLLLSNDLKTNVFTSISIANQIYTPADLTRSDLIVDDRPYAGWTYLEAGMHKSTKESLSSLQLKIGIVGPSS